MTKYKCDICKEKHDKIHVCIECSDCYLEGIDREIKKGNLLRKEDVDNQIEIVKLVCLGLTHPPENNVREFTKWLQDTVIFHLKQLKIKSGDKK